MRELEIDIAVDLRGYTGRCAPGILALRPAPVQVNYLGFPGTMARPTSTTSSPIAIVIPEAEQRHYSEKVVYLPDTYHAERRETRVRPIARSAARKRACRKRASSSAASTTATRFTPEIFDVWMRLLQGRRRQRAVAVRAQRHRPPQSQARSRERAASTPDRLVFAPFLSNLDDHLARLTSRRSVPRHAALQRAHHGERCAVGRACRSSPRRAPTFAGRVAASLLSARRAARTDRAVAVRLRGARARARARSGGTRARSKRSSSANRASFPLFDTARFTRHLEAAFAAMRERQRRGLPPERFSVVALAMNDALLINAVRLHQAGDLAGAERLYGAVLRASPRHAQALYLLGFVHFQRGQFDDAERLIGQSLQVNPQSPDAWYNRGCALAAAPAQRRGRVLFRSRGRAEARLRRGLDQPRRGAAGAAAARRGARILQPRARAEAARPRSAQQPRHHVVRAEALRGGVGRLRCAVQARARFSLCRRQRGARARLLLRLAPAQGGSRTTPCRPASRARGCLSAREHADRGRSDGSASRGRDLGRRTLPGDARRSGAASATATTGFAWPTSRPTFTRTRPPISRPGCSRRTTDRASRRWRSRSVPTMRARCANA